MYLHIEGYLTFYLDELWCPFNVEDLMLQLLLYPESDDSAQLSQVLGFEILLFL